MTKGLNPKKNALVEASEFTLWIINALFLLVVGGLGFTLKNIITSIKALDERMDKRAQEVENRFSRLETSVVRLKTNNESLLNLFEEKLSGIKSQISELKDSVSRDAEKNDKIRSEIIKRIEK